MNDDRLAAIFAPLVAARRKALAEANRTGRPVVVSVPGGCLTVEPSAALRGGDAA